MTLDSKLIGGRVRSSILRFMSVEDVVAASHVNDAWYTAAAAPVVWASKLAQHPLAQQAQGEVVLESAAQYRAVLNVKGEKFDEILSEPPIIPLGLAFGMATDVCSNQFPLATLLLRHPKLYALKDQDPIEGYPGFPMWQIVHAVAIRFGSIRHIKPEYFPWFISVYRFGASTQSLVPYFHKELLMPCLYLLFSHESPALAPKEGEAPVKPPTLSTRDFDDLIDVTTALVKKYFPADVPSQAPVEPVDDKNPLLLFGAFFRIGRAAAAPESGCPTEKVREQVAAAVAREFGANGTAQLAFAEKRVSQMIADEPAKKKQKEADRQARLDARLAAAAAPPPAPAAAATPATAGAAEEE